MTSPLKSTTLIPGEKGIRPTSNWGKVGVVAAASALIGGLAAAWWYRKTLKKLRQSEEIYQNPEFGMPAEDADYDL